MNPGSPLLFLLVRSSLVLWVPHVKKKNKNHNLFPSVQKYHGNKSHKCAIFQRFALGFLVEAFQKQWGILATIILFPFFPHNVFLRVFPCVLHYFQEKLSSHLVLKAFLVQCIFIHSSVLQSLLLQDLITQSYTRHKYIYVCASVFANT